MNKIDKENLQKLITQIEKYIPDCGDNSCFFAYHRGGMRTNGGCRCFQEVFEKSGNRKLKYFLQSLSLLYKETKKILEEI